MRQREWEIFHMVAHSPQMPTTARAEPGRSQEVEIQSWSPMWMAGTQGLNNYLLPWRIHNSRKLELEQGPLTVDRRCPKQHLQSHAKHSALRIFVMLLKDTLKDTKDLALGQSRLKLTLVVPPSQSIWAQLLCFQSSYPRMYLRKQQKTAQVLDKGVSPSLVGE